MIIKYYNGSYNEINADISIIDDIINSGGYIIYAGYIEQTGVYVEIPINNDKNRENYILWNYANINNN